LISSDGSQGISGDCSIYADSGNLEAIVNIVGAGMKADGIFFTPGLKAFMAHNDYEVGLVYGSNFLSWPSVLECEQTAEAEAFVNAVRCILESLWGANIRAVAACDFEDRLPHSGGIDLFR
jgi:hypothetical protein